MKPKLANQVSRLFLLISVGLVGCAPGYIYTDIVEPYCTNMQNTPVGTKRGDTGIKQLKIPYTSTGLNFVWSSNAIADAMKKGEIKQVQYCDLETFSVLGGIWKQQNIVVYGD